MSITAIVWFRKDLRLQDNPAIAAAVERGYCIIPLYIHAPHEEGNWPQGGASRWWLHHALRDLAEQIRAAGGNLIIRQGESEKVIVDMLKSSGATVVLWNRRYEPAIIARDAGIKAKIKELGYEVESFNASLLREPHTVANQSGTPFKVFTPFFKYCQTLSEPEPFDYDTGNISFDKYSDSDSLESLKLLPKIPWDKEFYRFWVPTRQGALDRLNTFIAEWASSYQDKRNRPDLDGTSRLSPFLHFGQIGPREVVAALKRGIGTLDKGAHVFLSEIYWREFAYHILYHFPSTPEQPLRTEFERFPWVENDALLRLWQRGQTGYPIVDAGMRQLWQTGWMHNRVRMIVASLLVKHMLIPWQAGTQWFWDTLVDADIASNTLGWQWTAGCGADAAPYFRVFNPIIQGEKFDPDGDYVRAYVPELARLPKAYIHRPWEAPVNILAYAGVKLGQTYPLPVIEHSEGRARALQAFDALQAQRENA